MLADIYDLGYRPRRLRLCADLVGLAHSCMLVQETTRAYTESVDKPIGLGCGFDDRDLINLELWTCPDLVGRSVLDS